MYFFLPLSLFLSKWQPHAKKYKIVIVTRMGREEVSYCNTADSFEGKVYPPPNVYLKMIKEITTVVKNDTPPYRRLFGIHPRPHTRCSRTDKRVHTLVFLFPRIPPTRGSDLSFPCFFFVWNEQIGISCLISLFISYKRWHTRGNLLCLFCFFFHLTISSWGWLHLRLYRPSVLPSLSSTVLPVWTVLFPISLLSLRL